jgi:hypothetical protein
MTFAVKADATQSAASEAGDELSATCNRGKCRETRLTARRLPCSCKGLAPEANLKIAERGEDKADAQQGARLKSLPAFSAHSQALHTAHTSPSAFSTDSLTAPHTAHNNPTGFVVQRVFLQMKNTREIT